MDLSISLKGRYDFEISGLKKRLRGLQKDQDGEPCNDCKLSAT